MQQPKFNLTKDILQQYIGNCKDYLGTVMKIFISMSTKYKYGWQEFLVLVGRWAGHLWQFSINSSVKRRYLPNAAEWRGVLMSPFSISSNWGSLWSRSFMMDTDDVDSDLAAMWRRVSPWPLVRLVRSKCFFLASKFSIMISTTSSLSWTAYFKISQIVRVVLSTLKR